MKTGCRTQGFGCRVHGTRFGVKGSKGSGFRVQGWRVEGPMPASADEVQLFWRFWEEIIRIRNVIRNLTKLERIRYNSGTTICECTIPAFFIFRKTGSRWEKEHSSLHHVVSRRVPESFTITFTSHSSPPSTLECQLSFQKVHRRAL